MFEFCFCLDVSTPELTVSMAPQRHQPSPRARSGDARADIRPKSVPKSSAQANEGASGSNAREGPGSPAGHGGRCARLLALPLGVLRVEAFAAQSAGSENTHMAHNLTAHPSAHLTACLGRHDQHLGTKGRTNGPEETKGLVGFGRTWPRVGADRGQFCDQAGRADLLGSAEFGSVSSQNAEATGSWLNPQSIGHLPAPSPLCRHLRSLISPEFSPGWPHARTNQQLSSTRLPGRRPVKRARKGWTQTAQRSHTTTLRTRPHAACSRTAPPRRPVLAHPPKHSSRTRSKALAGASAPQKRNRLSCSTPLPQDAQSSNTASCCMASGGWVLPTTKQSLFSRATLPAEATRRSRLSPTTDASSHQADQLHDPPRREPAMFAATPFLATGARSRLHGTAVVAAREGGATRSTRGRLWAKLQLSRGEPFLGPGFAIASRCYPKIWLSSHTSRRLPRAT